MDIGTPCIFTIDKSGVKKVAQNNADMHNAEHSQQTFKSRIERENEKKVELSNEWVERM